MSDEKKQNEDINPPADAQAETKPYYTAEEGWTPEGIAEQERRAKEDAEEPLPEVIPQPYSFTVNRLEFLRELAVAARAVETKTTIPILAHIRLVAVDGWLMLIATDLELAYACVCRATVHQEGSSTLPAKDLLKIVRDLDGDEIKFETSGDFWMGLTCGTSTMRISGMSALSFPELPKPQRPLTTIRPDVLADLIGKTAFAISAEESRFTLNGALMLIEPERITMVATDGHRMAHATAAVTSSVEDGYRVLVPRGAMTELAFLAKQKNAPPFLLSHDESHLFWQAGLRVFTCRKLTGNFPDYERVLPQGAAAVTVTDSDALGQILTRSLKFADQRSHAVTLDLGAEVRVDAKSVELGEYSEAVPARHAGEGMKIGFNANYILEFLKSIKGKAVAILATEPNKPAELRIAGDESLRYVLMPMRY